MTSPFDSGALRDWFFEDLDPPEEFTDGRFRLLVAGDGPFERVEFVDFLNFRGMDAATMEAADDFESDSVLIIGEGGWRFRDVERWVLGPGAGSFRMYSQQMFLSYWATGLDPWDFPPVFESFVAGHVGLETIAESFPEIPWPSTEAPESPGPPSAPIDDGLGYAPRPGLLSVAGYRTGASGLLSDSARQSVLSKVFASKDLQRDFRTDKIGLPASLIPTYLAQWGAGSSAVRLRKAADTIAALCRNEKRNNRGGKRDLSIAHREVDLAFLKATYYDGRFDRPPWWPTTRA